MKIDGIEKTKTFWKAYYRQILNSYPADAIIGAEHKIEILNLLSHHEEAEEKIGIGIVEIQVVMEERYGVSKRFDLIREDGSRMDFSYIRCIDSPVDNHAIEVRQAFRCEIFPFIFKFKKEHFQENDVSTCAISGESVSRNRCHVDHVPPNTFKSIMDVFIASENISLGDIHIEYSDDMGDHSERKLSDRELAGRWYAAHAAVAKLRITSMQSNLRQKKCFMGKSA